VHYIESRLKVEGSVQTEHAMKAHMGSRSTALFFVNLGARRGWVVNAMPLLLHLQERKLVPTVHEAG